MHRRTGNAQEWRNATAQCTMNNRNGNSYKHHFCPNLGLSMQQVPRRQAQLTLHRAQRLEGQILVHDVQLTNVDLRSLGAVLQATLAMSHLVQDWHACAPAFERSQIRCFVQLHDLLHRCQAQMTAKLLDIGVGYRDDLEFGRQQSTMLANLVQAFVANLFDYIFWEKQFHHVQLLQGKSPAPVTHVLSVFKSTTHERS